MRRTDIEVASLPVDTGSWGRQLCYPRGSFSVIPSPQEGGLRGSLGQAFAPASSCVEDTVRPASGLVLYGGFLTRLSRPLDPLDNLSRGCRPSETAQLQLSYFRSEEPGQHWAVLHGCLRQTWRPGLDSSRLRFTMSTRPQPQPAVKLHGVFASLREFLVSAPDCRFTGTRAGTVGSSLIRSCRPPIQRQGTSLP